MAYQLLRHHCRSTTGVWGNEPEMQSTGQMDKLARLEGAEFKIAFMEMIKHHQKVIREAERCLDPADHVEL